MKFLPNLKIVKEPKKAAKCLAIFCALTLGIAAIFYSPSDLSSATTTVDCASLPDTTLAEPGNNCLFSAMTPTGSKVLPLCQTIDGIVYNIDPSNIASAGTRLLDCVNLSDLPLCSNPVSADDKPGKNCVKTCGGSDVDHNRNCVRFCQSPPEAGFTDPLVKDVNCIDIKCHQLAVGTVPVSNGANTNCTLTPCNLLTPKELMDVDYKISQDMNSNTTVGKYCEGTVDIKNKPLKCYNFNKDQLPYVIKGNMCIVHNCQAPCANYTSQTDTNGDGVINAYDNDDTLNVSDHNRDGITDASDTDYVANYILTINGNEPLTSTSYCTPTFCLPVVKKQFRCVEHAGGDTPTGDSTKDTQRNAQCDTTGDGAVCTNNLCFKTIDCNLAVNNSGSNAQPECAQTTDGSIGSTGDTTDAWFYRPKPMNKATMVNDGANPMRYLAPMEFKSDEDHGDNICYTAGQMKERDDNFEPGISDGGFQPSNKWGREMIIPGFTIPYTNIHVPSIDLGWFHSSILPDEARSPGICSIKKRNNAGFRGNGYIYLCYGDGNPNAGQLYAKVADHTAYHRGYVQTTFTEGNAIHKLNVCLRFKNALRPNDSASETCGSRECAVTCMGFAGGCSQENCGYDECRDFTITDNASSDCTIPNDVSGDVDRSCLRNFDTAVIDTFLRLRVQRYGNRICSFLDVKGQTAYDTVSDLFTKGTEKLKDGTCVSGSSGNSNNCSGHNSYTNPTLASVWRTIKFGESGNIPYIQNNQKDRDGHELPGAPKGYFNGQGEFFAEQECINIPLRIPPPRLYNLATANNSPKLFTPPFYILNALTEAGGIVSARGFDGSLGTTDFNYPAVLVNFGNTTQEMSLDFDVTGYETDHKVETITTTINNIPYSIEVFARKEFNETSRKTTFCIYRKIVSLDAVEQKPERIGCVDRKLPEIDNSIARMLNPALKPQQTIISLDPTSTFDSSRITLRYLAGFGANGVNDKCAAGSDDLCSSNSIILDNINSSIPTCNSSVIDPVNPVNVPTELNVVCAKREECTQLNIECMKNEIDMQTAKVSGQSIDSFLTVRNTCNNYLLPMCNAKKGITTSNATITDTNPTGATPNPKYYGWFNEICIVGDGTKTDSYDSKLIRVLAYKTSPEGFKGKCITLESSASCPDGGKAPNCNCKPEDPNVTPPADQEYRLQTHREAGLCVDMPLPQTCPAISYNPTSTIPEDPDYIYSSMKIISATGLPPASYGTNQNTISDVVHISHQLRNQAESAGHAEFPLAILGSIDITGSCKGFWKNGVSVVTGFTTPPTRTCVNDNGNAVWSDTTNTPCVRYSCPERKTTGALSAEIGASYQGGYASSEVGDAKGTADGFATWPSKLKTTDFMESASALACIPGFKKTGSTATTAGSVIRNYETQINGYSGGTTPTRSCSQIGTWQTPTNACERIKCPAINPPASPSTPEDWIKWYDAGGATFSQADASRSTSAGLVATGVCNNSLGFFNLGSAPTRECDYLGNWGPVINPCTTRCDAVNTADAAKSSNNGYAFWNQTDVTPPATQGEATFGGCVDSSYVAYPYPPLKNDYGVSYNLAKGSVTNYNYSDFDGFTFVDGTSSATAIPLKISDDTRAAGNPKKFCRAVSFDGVVTNTWAAANSSCINACPGYTTDPRIGVGTTQHDLSDGTKVTLKWSSATFGTWHYFSSTDADGTSNVDTPDFNGQAADTYSESRTNHKFILARFCGDGSNGTTKGKWEEPIPQCATNDGIITQGGVSSHATYSNSSARIGIQGRTASKTVSVNDTATSSSCQSGGVYFPTGSDTTPVAISSYQCVYKSGNKIDEVYFNKISGSPCQVYCTPPAVNTIFGNSKYTGTPAAPNYTAVGGTLDLDGCASNYGKAEDSDANTSDDSCGIENKNRGKTPKVTCQSNGVFGNVTNNCTSCASCSCSNGSCTNDIFIKSTSDLTRVVPWTYANDGGSSTDDCFIAGPYTRTQAGSCGNSGDSQFNIYPGTVASGSYTDVKQTGSDSNSVTYRFQCYDSLFRVTQHAQSGHAESINYTTAP